MPRHVVLIRAGQEATRNPHHGLLTAPITRRSDRTTLLGSLAWISSIQFFVAQLVVQLAWTMPFSLRDNFISDLGNTACGSYPGDFGRYVCSPWHAWMNASFIVIGPTIVLGAAVLCNAFRHSRAWKWGLALLALGGSGFVLVGLFPENVSLPPHRLGAGLHFVSGNLGLVVLGISMLWTRSWRTWGAYSIASGVAGLVATALFVSGHYLSLGIGGMERIAAYPLPLWTIAMGIALSMRAGRS